MAIVTLGELLDRAAEFERLLERTYGTLRDESQDGGVRLLTYYLSRHRWHLQQALENFDYEQVSRIRKVRLKHDVPFAPDKGSPLIGAAPGEVTGRVLLEAAVGHDQKLVDLYRSILSQPVGEEARAFLEALIRLEETDMVMLRKMIAMDYF
jgi:hypothetical protein